MEVLYPARLLSSSTVLGYTSLAATDGLCPWSGDLQDPRPKSLFCSQTTPWNKLLVFSQFSPCSDLSHRTMTSFLSLREYSPATASHSPPWEPSSLLWLQQGGHRGAARVPTPSELTLVFQTPGCPKHTSTYCSHPPLPPPKLKASKLISLAAYNRTATPLYVLAWTPLLLALSLKQQRKAPAQRPRVKIIWSGFRSGLPPKPELAQCQDLAVLKL